MIRRLHGGLNGDWAFSVLSFYCLPFILLFSSAAGICHAPGQGRRDRGTGESFQTPERKLQALKPKCRRRRWPMEQVDGHAFPRQKLKALGFSRSNFGCQMVFWNEFHTLGPRVDPYSLVFGFRRSLISPFKPKRVPFLFLAYSWAWFRFSRFVLRTVEGSAFLADPSYGLGSS